MNDDHGIINLNFETVDIGEMHPQGDINLHGHSFGELVFIESGRAIHFTEHQEYEISGRDIFYIRKGINHGYRDCEDLHLINIFFHHDLMVNDLRELDGHFGYQALFEWESQLKQKTRDQRHFKVNEAEWSQLMDCYGTLKIELREHQDRHLQMSKWLLLRLILLCSRFFSDRLKATGETPMNASISSVAKVMSYVETHYHQKIYTDDLAAVANTSLSTLQRNFKSVNGSGLSDYLNRVRVKRACSDLQSGTKTINDIAYSVGFEDGNYFSKVFRRHMGISPRDYRHQQQSS